MYYIGIDLGGTLAKVGIVNERGRVLAKTSLRTLAYRKKDLINEIIVSIIKLVSSRRIKRNEIGGIGVGLPGLIDSKRGIVRYLVNISGWKNVHFKKIFEQKLNIKTYIDNDVNVMTLGELYHGAGRGVKNMVCITLGTGVGGGIVINGKLYRGKDLVAGEIGHIPINEDGPKCNCGGTACIESYAGNRYLMNKLKNDLKKNPSVLKKLYRVKHMSPPLALVDKAARMGDKFSIRFWEEVGLKLGTMLTGVVNLLNPEKIVIGGGVANAVRFIMVPIKKTINKRAMKIQRKRVKIVRAGLGKDAGMIGAAVLAKFKGGV